MLWKMPFSLSSDEKYYCAQHKRNDQVTRAEQLPEQAVDKFLKPSDAKCHCAALLQDGVGEKIVLILPVQPANDNDQQRCCFLPAGSPAESACAQKIVLLLESPQKCLIPKRRCQKRCNQYPDINPTLYSSCEAKSVSAAPAR